MNAWKRGIERSYQVIGAWIRPNLEWVRRFEREKECLGRERKVSIEKEVRKWNLKSHLSFKEKWQLNGLRFLLGIYRALNLDRNESVEVPLRICRWQKSVSMDWESVENLSSRQNAHKFGLMDRRSCWVGTQKSRWIEKLLRFYQEETQKSRWIENLSRCYREKRKKAQ